MTTAGAEVTGADARVGGFELEALVGVWDVSVMKDVGEVWLLLILEIFVVLIFGCRANSPGVGTEAAVNFAGRELVSALGIEVVDVVASRGALVNTRLLLARVIGRVTGMLVGSGGGGGPPTTLTESIQALTHPS